MSAGHAKPRVVLDDELVGETAADLYENAPAGYLTTLPDGEIVKANETFARWTGHAKDTLIRQRRFQDLLTVPGRIYFETHVSPLLRMQGEVSEIALDIRCVEGAVLPVLINAVTRGGTPGAPGGYRITVFNATERRRYERELLAARRRAEEAAHAKSDLLAMLGHDIRTPLGAITNVARLLEATEPTPQQRPLVGILRRSSDSLVVLINDILEYSRLEAGKLRAEERPFSLRSMLEDLKATIGVRAAEKGLDFSVELDETVPDLLFGDAVKILQVLTNLAGNALKFTNEGGVAVSVRALALEGGRVKLELVVRDTGIGIANDQLRNIFEEFTQANAEIGLKYGGTGLGLAISRKLLALFGSAIRVESTPGRGSSFAFELDLRVVGEH